MPPQPKPELPNPAAAHEHFATRAARIPGRAAAGSGRRDAAHHQRNSRTATRRRARDRAGTAARSPARTGNPAQRTGGDAVGAHCRFRKRDQRNSGREPRAGQHLQLHRRRAPRRAGRRRRTARRQGRPRPVQVARRRQSQGIEQGCEQGTVDHHLQDPLAAGRRERGRDRARHLQDGDDAARRRQPPRRCPRWRVRASRRLRSSRPRSTAPNRRRRRPRCPR